jgi:hypothetical protein
MHQAEQGESVKSLWIYKLYVVVVHMQPGQTPEAIKSVFLKFSDFVIAHF